MSVAREPGELERRPRAVAIGTFDGVHLGHQAVIGAATDHADALTPSVVTFHPHPRTALSGNRVELLSTLQRRLEQLEDCRAQDELVRECPPGVAAGRPEAERATSLGPLG